MSVLDILQHYLPLACPQTAAEIDAEIREELEFHLEMRTRDNMRAGMPPAEAHRDAQLRFGDFEASRRACRQITLGPKLALQRMRTVLLLLVLMGAVAYLGVALVRVQTANRGQIETLTRMIEQLQSGQRDARAAPATIPFVQWNFDSAGDSYAEPASNSAESDELHDWNQADSSLEQPWSDWKSLDR